LRRLLDRSKAGAAAGGAFAFGPVRFGVFHFRSQISLIRPHYRSNGISSRISGTEGAPIFTSGRAAPKPQRVAGRGAFVFWPK
jgi:hypothetical protein